MSAAILRTCGDRLRTQTAEILAADTTVNQLFRFDFDPPTDDGYTYVVWIEFIAFHASSAVSAVQLRLQDPTEAEQFIPLFDDFSAGTTIFVVANNDGEGYILPTHDAGATHWEVQFRVTKAVGPLVGMQVHYEYVRMGDNMPFFLRWAQRFWDWLTRRKAPGGA